MSEHLSPDHCPSDPAEIAERYCMNRLSAGERQAFEDHYIACPKCTEEVEKAQAFIKGIRDAARRLKEDKPKG